MCQYVLNVSQYLGVIEDVDGRMSGPEEKLEQPEKPLAVLQVGKVIYLHDRRVVVWYSDIK